MDESCFIDGFGPLPVFRPGSVAEVAELVRQAGKERRAVYPVGGRTSLHLGCPPQKPGWAVDLGKLDQVIDYPARDMTITVQAGIPIARLQEILARENQRLPIDVPLAEKATLGGILACNTSGPRRLGFGTLRDYLLGVSAINDQGLVFKSGGRVVKNVAGYDLCKLLIGSLGTLGIITQATLKLRPLPEEQALISLACPDDKLETLLDQVHASRTRPVCLEILNAAAARIVFSQAGLVVPESPWLAIVGFEGNTANVQWQVQQLVRELGTGFSLEARLGSPARSLWEALREFPVFPEAALTFQAYLLPSATAGFCLQAQSGTDEFLLRAHAGNGIVQGHGMGEWNKEKARPRAESWRALAGPGRIQVLRCPPSWKDPALVWGSPFQEARLMKEIKDKFDPGHLFNPGRFVEGL